MFGEVRLAVAGGKRLDHAGVRLELKGVLDVSCEKAPHEFVAQVVELCGPGSLTGVTSLPFAFAKAMAPVESYVGTNARVSYLLRAIVSSRGTFSAAGGLTRELELVARNPTALPPPPEGAGGGAAVAGGDPDAGVKLEVGIEDCLHIEFEYSRTRYHLGDVVTGKIEFLQLGIKLKRMEVAVVRKETVGLGAWGFPILWGEGGAQAVSFPFPALARFAALAKTSSHPPAHQHIPPPQLARRPPFQTRSSNSR